MPKRAPFQPEYWMKPRKVNEHWCYWFFESTYNDNIFLIWPVSEQQRRAFIEEHFGIEPDASDGGWNARVTHVLTDDGRGGQVIAFKEWDGSGESYGRLAHECLHVVENITSMRNIAFSNEPGVPNEPHAYLLAKIVKKCVTALQWTERGKR